MNKAFDYELTPMRLLSFGCNNSSQGLNDIASHSDVLVLNEDNKLMAVFAIQYAASVDDLVVQPKIIAYSKNGKDPIWLDPDPKVLKKYSFDFNGNVQSDNIILKTEVEEVADLRASIVTPSTEALLSAQYFNVDINADDIVVEAHIIVAFPALQLKFFLEDADITYIPVEHGSDLNGENMPLYALGVDHPIAILRHIDPNDSRYDPLRESPNPIDVSMEGQIIFSKKQGE